MSTGSEPNLGAISDESGKFRNRGRRLAVAIIISVFVLILLLVLIFPGLGFARIYRVPTASMSPALVPDDYIYANSFQYLFHSPKRGDVIVITTDQIAGMPHSPEAPSFFKRLVGLSGEELSIHNGHIYVNGRLAEELQSFEYIPTSLFLNEDGVKTVVPNDSYFVLGDNTRNSFDSRFWGGVPKSNLKGRALLRFWPLDRIGLL